MVPGRRRPLLGGQVAEFLGLSLSADEMVLEAAANGGATHLLTWNIKDVGPASIFGINVLTPTAFLSLQPDEES